MSDKLVKVTFAIYESQVKKLAKKIKARKPRVSKNAYIRELIEKDN